MSLILELEPENREQTAPAATRPPSAGRGRSPTVRCPPPPPNLAVPRGLEHETGWRRPGRPRAALVLVRERARAVAAEFGLGNNFVLTLMGLALKESNATLALPARRFDVRPPSARPPGCPLVSAWGVFQCNQDRWQTLVRRWIRGPRRTLIERAPWRATPEEELMLVIRQAAEVYRYLRAAGGGDIDALRGVMLEHEVRGIYHDQYRPESGVRLTPAEFRRRWAHLRNKEGRHVHGEHYDGVLWCMGISTNADGTIPRCGRTLVGPTLVVPERWRAWRGWLSEGRDRPVPASEPGPLPPAPPLAAKSHAVSRPPAIPQGPSAAIVSALPEAGPGFFSYTRPERRFGRAEVIRVLRELGAAWQRAHPDGPRIAIGDLSRRGGGPMPPHHSHQLGVDVDIRLMRQDGRETGVTFRDPAYSLALTRDLVNRLRTNGRLAVQYIFCNDPRLPGTRQWAGHENHLHVRFQLPPQRP